MWCWPPTPLPHREVVAHGQTGLLVSGRDTDGTGCGRHLPCSPTAPLHRPLGDAASLLVREHYSQDVCLPRLAERFTALVAAAGATAMNVLFIHDAFPAQFGRLALELTRRHGWQCSFLVQSLSSCPTPSREMLETLELHKLPLAAEHRTSDGIPWPQIYGHYLEQCRTVHDALQAKPNLRPDLIVAHGGRVRPPCYCVKSSIARSSSIANITLPTAIGTSRIASTCRRPSRPRFFRAASTRRLWRRWLIVMPATRRPSGRNNRSLPAFTRRSRFISTESRPISITLAPRRGEIGDNDHSRWHARRHLCVTRSRIDPRVRPIHEGCPANRPATLRRGLRCGWWRGNPLWLGQLHTGSPSFKQWVLSQDSYELSRFIFLGRILPEQLADILRISDLHIYLTAPFVLSWSLLDAMATGCVVLGSDVPPVREVIEPGQNGLIEPLFDVDRLTETALRVLGDPAEFAPLGRGLAE